MSYAKQTWADGRDGGTPISAARLAHMEDGISAADAEIAGRLSSGSLGAASVAAVEGATTVAPTGAWNFTQAPTVAGVAIGTGGSSPDATSTVKGVVQLAGDLGGTAAAPTVPGLAGKAATAHTHTAVDVSDSTTVGRSVLTAVDATAARTAIGAGTSSLAIGTSGTTAAAGNDARLADTRTPTDSSVTNVKVAAAAAINADKLADGTTNKLLTATERTKLTGIATGATANATDAQLRDRTTHTGTQAATTITGLATVATSGSYTDLSSKPTIPTVGAAGTAGAALSATDPTTTNARTPSAHTHPAADLTATGTRDATTYLRGDNTWATPAGGGGSSPVQMPAAKYVMLSADQNGTLSLPLGTEYSFPFFIPGSGSLDQIGFNLNDTANNADTVVRFGVRADNSGVPGAVLIETSIPAGPGAVTGWKTLAASLPCNAIYWFSLCPQGSASNTIAVRNAGNNGNGGAFSLGGLAGARTSPDWASGHGPTTAVVANASGTLASTATPIGSNANLISQQVPVFIARRA